MTLELDITDFLQKVRENHDSLTLALVYAVSRCANEIEEFRYRFVDGIHIGKLIDLLQNYLNEG